jgi:signal transduction histidine kinase
MSVTTENVKTNIWEQWDWVWHISAFIFLGLHIFFAVTADTPIQHPLFFFALTGFLALWYVRFLFTQVLHFQQNQFSGMLYILIGWIMLAFSVSFLETSLLLAGMFYPMIFTRFPIHTAITLALMQTLGLYMLFVTTYAPQSWLSALFFALIIVCAAILIGLFISSLIKQSIQRQALIDELTESRASIMRLEREAGKLAERQRLSREIHDTLAQQFTSIIMHLSAAKLKDESTYSEHFIQAEQTARDGLQEARRMVSSLHQTPQVEGSFIHQIEKSSARWSIENKTPVHLNITGEVVELPEPFNHALGRIHGEALHNIKKHACANQVDVTLSYMSDTIIMDIVDDGVGFAPSHSYSGFGLTSMHERISELQGTLNIESEPKNGTRISVNLPLLEAQS